MSEVTLGGNRLGSGNRQKVYLRNFERSTHDLGYTWKSTVSPGTLVPFLNEVALPGDTFDIDYYVDVMTLPTNGPLFGSFKLQVDTFQIPVRLYQAKLHQNALGIGMQMDQVKLPMYKLVPKDETGLKDLPIQVSPSSLIGHLGVSGVGRYQDANEVASRWFTAIPYLGYYDIYKQYYANKQEEVGVTITTDNEDGGVTVVEGFTQPGDVSIPLDSATNIPFTFFDFHKWSVRLSAVKDSYPIENFSIEMSFDNGTTWGEYAFNEIWRESSKVADDVVLFSLPKFKDRDVLIRSLTYYPVPDPEFESSPQLDVWPLDQIDKMRETILSHFTGTYVIDQDWGKPYGTPLRKGINKEMRTAYRQEGLAVKTYQSDLFNNWISTEWIDGDNGISKITAIDTSQGSFTIDELNLSRKVYDMLNRIAISGGTYDDWLDAVYTHERQRSAENPIYLGGLSQEIVFQEVVSTGDAKDETGNSTPLGSLAGRGRLGGDRKGGKVVVKVDEPSYLMGIVSITPRVCYSQGNKWVNTLRSMDDFHKPSLDEIGFQDLITDQMAYFDTLVERPAGSTITTYKSAGKQPAWINYMTNVDVAKGNFAEPKSQMFMTLNRRYEFDGNGISDLTTYVDPAKYNYIFADASLDAMNFWVQIRSDITARRKMSAKVMPNL